MAILLVASSVHAAPAKTLTIYTYSAFSSTPELGPAIAKAFEQKYHCKVKLVGLDDGVSLLNRLRLEGKHSRADIVLGLDNNLISAAEKTGLFASNDINLSKLSVPGGWNNTSFIPYDYGYFAFVYNQQKLKNPPRSLKELVERKDIKIIYEDPRTSTPGLGLLLWIHKVYGDKASQAWQQLAQKTITVPKSWSDAYGMFLKGESDMVLSYTTSPAYHIMMEHTDTYQAADFKEGHYMQIEVAARLKNAPNPELAKDFLRFMLTPAFQERIPTGNWMYPVTRVKLPKAFNQLPVPAKALSYSPQEVAKNRQAWVRQWRSAVTQ
ncbi:thiamine ABC transporter substrate binding subunit [Dongshaea marina]|uniref:thiamine ABC transporter substrate binding subunit n=1 Tax=Dongshaea marina TaxID=2047966 RepID=UPI001F2551A0|nr:thiamine ABC transporter substrate binding subunit [Dongshaea marina]